VIAILMLALGIAANTAVFSVFNQVILRTLPVRNPNQLVVLREKSAAEEGALSSWGDNALYFSYPTYLSMRDRTHTLEGLAAAALDGVNLATRDSADNVITEFVTGNYFNVLAVRPLGRVITPADDYHKGNPVAVLSEAYWQCRFGSDPAVLNRINEENVFAIPPEGRFDPPRVNVDKHSFRVSSRLPSSPFIFERGQRF
jgi:putative ABC transport system permease protein